MKTRTLYISDLDGTLLDSNSIVTSHSIENINHLLQKGMLFTIATARTPATVVPLLKQLQLDLPVVLMNGAVHEYYSTTYETNITYKRMDSPMTRPSVTSRCSKIET